jgi:predicted transcriptional regulator
MKMTEYKIQSHESLKQEMMAVARGERSAPPDAAMPSFNSIEALTRLLTPENRALLATIRDRKPRSISELAEMTGRAQPNLTRTLAKLEAVGFVQMRLVARRKVPTATVHRLHVEIDPFSQNDRLVIA